jgi:hypothetical protein
MPRLIKLLTTARRQLPDMPVPQTFATPLNAGTEYIVLGDSTDAGFVTIQVGCHMYVVDQESLLQATA